MVTVDERELSHLKEPTFSYTPYSLVDPAQHQPLAARGRLCRTALLVSSVLVIGSLFVTKVGLDSRDAVSLASVVATRSKKSPAPLSVKDPVGMGFPPIPRASMVKVPPPWQGPSSPPEPPQSAFAGSWPLDRAQATGRPAIASGA